MSASLSHPLLHMRSTLRLTVDASMCIRCDRSFGVNPPVSITTTSVAVTFNTAMDSTTLTALTTAGTCDGNVPVSADNFVTCLGFTTATPVMTSSNTVATWSIAGGNLAFPQAYKVRVLSGAVGQKVEGWRRDLIRAGALLEATIDFADEDVPVDVSPEVLVLIDGLMADLGREAAGVSAAERIRDGFEVAIVGAPNAGKSTLLNQLAGREAAITSEIAGTTRDVIEVRMEIAGLPVTFLDTAGLRDTEDRLERAGIERALARAEAADLRLFLADGSALPLEPAGDDLVVMGKADTISGASGLAVSGKTGSGVPELMARIGDILEARVGSAGALVRERHRVAVTTAIAALAESRAEVVRPDSRVELAAEHLRQAVRALDALVGRVDVDDLLGEIFASFCIGK